MHTSLHMTCDVRRARKIRATHIISIESNKGRSKGIRAVKPLMIQSVVLLIMKIANKLSVISRPLQFWTFPKLPDLD